MLPEAFVRPGGLSDCAPFCAPPLSNSITDGSKSAERESPVMARKINTITNRRNPL